MKEVPLTQGQVALVDDEDYERVVAAGPWYAQHRRNSFRAARNVVVDHKRLVLTLASFILDVPRGTLVDHINRNSLDNRRVNLRLASPSVQNHNRNSRVGSASQYKGVFRPTTRKRWQAEIRYNGRKYHLGMFDSEQEAARAYDAAAREVYGAEASLNFPNDKDTTP